MKRKRVKKSDKETILAMRKQLAGARSRAIAMDANLSESTAKVWALERRYEITRRVLMECLLKHGRVISFKDSTNLAATPVIRLLKNTLLGVTVVCIDDRPATAMEKDDPEAL